MMPNFRSLDMKLVLLWMSCCSAVSGAFLPSLSFMTRPFPHTSSSCVPLKTWRHFLQGSPSSSAFALEKDVNSSSHHSCVPGAPFEPSLRPSDTGANLLGVPASSCVPALLSWAQPTGWGPGLALAHPCPQAAACAQGWSCPPAVLFPGWEGEAVPCQLHGQPPLLVHPRELLDFTGTQVPR